MVAQRNLRSQQSQWERLGRSDPMWAILNDPAKRNGGWDEQEFFATGQADVAALMAKAGELGRPPARQAALDFGCGVGRLTQALADHFHEVTGVDIAPAMVEKARRYNRHGDRCRYVLNPRGDLGLFPAAAFDLVFSRITLQHLPRRQIRSYLTEFVRVLRPGGLLAFQLPDRHRTWRHRLSHSLYQLVARRLLRRPGVMEMYGLPKREVVALLEANGARLLRMEDDPAAGPGWVSWLYFATRQE